jgi:hypothetical protein
VFRSKVRSIIIPQYEHGRLAGTFASVWGNKDFERPVIDFASFVQGVALHDWHYGIIDNVAIGEAAEADWLEMVRSGANYWFNDPITDIVAKLHLKRLLNGRDLPGIDELVNLIEFRIAERLSQTRFSRKQFEWADRITEYCDQLAFDFSFEEPVKASRAVFAKENSDEEIPITYEIKPGGEIMVDPWPFSVDEFHGIITGYYQTGYPEMLTPEIIQFRCNKCA